MQHSVWVKLHSFVVLHDIFFCFDKSNTDYKKSRRKIFPKKISKPRRNTQPGLILDLPLNLTASEWATLFCSRQTQLKLQFFLEAQRLISSAITAISHGHCSRGIHNLDFAIFVLYAIVEWGNQVLQNKKANPRIFTCQQKIDHENSTGTSLSCCLLTGISKKWRQLQNVSTHAITTITGA